jgi:hypothetical protein
VHLRYPGDERYNSINHGVVVSRTVLIAGGQEASVSLYQPPVEIANQSMEVRVEGVKDGGLIPVSSVYGGSQFNYRARGYYGGPTGNPRPAVLLSRSVPQDFRDRGGPKAPTKSRRASRAPVVTASPGPVPPPAPSTGTSPQPEPFEFLRSELSINQWSGNWLGY